MRQAVAWGIVIPVLLLVIGLLMLRTVDCPTTVLSTGDTSVMLGLINDYRTENGLRRLAVDSKLQLSAEWLVLDMAANGYTSHTDSLGHHLGQRLASFGYTEASRGEVIAAGMLSEDKVLRSWKESPTHDKVLRVPIYQTAGVAFVEVEGSVHTWYWVVDFGVLPTLTPTPVPVLPTATPVPTSTPSPCSP